jgi:hypothetical protein
MILKTIVLATAFALSGTAALAQAGTAGYGSVVAPSVGSYVWPSVGSTLAVPTAYTELQLPLKAMAPVAPPDLLVD